VRDLRGVVPRAGGARRIAWVHLACPSPCLYKTMVHPRNISGSFGRRSSFRSKPAHGGAGETCSSSSHPSSSKPPAPFLLLHQLSRRKEPGAQPPRLHRRPATLNSKTATPSMSTLVRPPSRAAARASARHPRPPRPCSSSTSTSALGEHADETAVDRDPSTTPRSRIHLQGTRREGEEKDGLHYIHG
jgi:hypothetical protein